MLPAGEPQEEAGWGCGAGSISNQWLPNSTDLLPTSTSRPGCATGLVEERREAGTARRRPGRGVEFRKQNGFAGLNPFWSRKVFLAPLQRCPGYCGKALSADHRFASAEGSVTRLAERGWGTKSFLAEKTSFHNHRGGGSQLGRKHKQGSSLEISKLLQKIT